jgi:translation initiation factor 2B subunit (eIF-2B alpha/beta/delta family)
MTAPQGGAQSLQESRHNSDSANNGSANSRINDLIDQLVDLAIPEAKGRARSTAASLRRAIETVAKTNQPNQPNDLSLANLRKVVAEEVKAAISTQKVPPGGQKTWAAVAAQGTDSSAAAAPPAKVVPARLNREVLIRARNLPADLAKRTPQEIVQAVNQASTRKGAIAARKLPSGDTIVTF